MLQEATATGTITVPDNNFGLTLTAGSINGQPAVIASILQNSTGSNKTMDVGNGTYYFIGTYGAQTPHLVVDLDGYSHTLVDNVRTDSLPVRTVYYNTIINLDPQ